MTPIFDNWRNTEQTRVSFDARGIVNRDVVEITLYRDQAAMDVQCVRVVPAGSGSEDSQTVANNVASSATVVVIGDSDLNIKKGDLFTFRSTRYKVFYVESGLPGQIQARAEGMQ